MECEGLKFQQITKNIYPGRENALVNNRKWFSCVPTLTSGSKDAGGAETQTQTVQESYPLSLARTGSCVYLSSFTA